MDELPPSHDGLPVDLCWVAVCSPMASAQYAPYLGVFLRAQLGKPIAFQLAQNRRDERGKQPKLDHRSHHRVLSQPTYKASGQRATSRFSPGRISSQAFRLAGSAVRGFRRFVGFGLSLPVRRGRPSGDSVTILPLAGIATAAGDLEFPMNRELSTIRSSDTPVSMPRPSSM